MSDPSRLYVNRNHLGCGMVGGNMHEDKNKICQLLLKTLQATDNLWNLEGLNYYPEKEIVIAVFENGAKKSSILHGIQESQ